MRNVYSAMVAARLLFILAVRVPFGNVIVHLTLTEFTGKNREDK